MWHIPAVFALWMSFLSLAVSAVAIYKRRVFYLFAAVSIFFLGAFSYAVHNIIPVSDASRFAGGPGGKVIIVGTVVSDAESESRPFGRIRNSFDLKSEYLFLQNWSRISGKVRVNMIRYLGGDAVEKARYGDRVAIAGTLSLPEELSNPAGFDYGRYLARNGIRAVFASEPIDGVKALASSASLKNILFGLRERISDASKVYMRDPEGSVFRALILGERSDMDWRTKDDFIKTGTVHILAISGLHVGLIAFILIFIFTAARVPHRASYLIAMPLLIAYAVFVGARPSVVRAVIMACIFMTGLVLKRRSDIYNSISAAASAILIFDPNALFDPGFQLSFMAVLSIVYLTPRLEELFSARSRLSRYLLISLSAPLGVMPLTIYYFNIVSFSIFIANIIAIPLLFLIISLGLPFSVSLFLHAAPLSTILSKCLVAVIHILLKFTSELALMPFSYMRSAPLPILFIVLYYFIVMAYLKKSRLIASPMRILTILLIAANIVAYGGLFRAPDDRIRVTFFDVGHGDSAFIEFPGGGNMLVDTGGAGDNEAARWVISPYLWKRGIRRIDSVMLTHSDSDHMGGIDTIAGEFEVSAIYFNGLKGDSFPYDICKSVSKRRHIAWQAVREGYMIEGYKDAKIYILNPPDGFLDTENMDNDNSVVVKLVYGKFGLLLCGDIGDEGIKSVLRYGRLLESTAVELPHHGRNRTAMNNLLIDAVKADIFIVSSSGKAPMRYQGLAGLYDTSRNGAITITSDGVKHKVNTIKRNSQ